MRYITVLVIAGCLMQWACAMQRPMVMRKITAYSKIEDGQECSICLDELKKNLVITSCEHVFHKKCLSEWQKKKDLCPLCRNPKPLSAPSQPKQRLSFCICS